MLDPSLHSLPAAHEVHVVRDMPSLAPPDVTDPGGQIRHVPLCAALYCVSAPHRWQSTLPLEEKCPALHTSRAPFPSHLYPAGQTVHCVLVFSELPPVVYEPGSHFEHTLAASRLNRFAAPQSWHAALLGAEYFPDVHMTAVLPPPQTNPAAHALHAVRCPLLPPSVNEPAAHVRHRFAPASAY